MPHVELVNTRTADGIRLDGALALPAHRDAASQRSVEAVLALHGTGGNFYQGTVFDELAPKLLADGMAVLRVNTRGHDVVSLLAARRGPLRIGGASERIAEAAHDVQAWLEFLTSRGFQSAALVGHSLGAIKALHAAIEAPHPAVKRIVAISPPRLSHSFYLSSEMREIFARQYRQAEALVAAGRGGELLDVAFPLEFLFSAENYIDKYGPEEKCNFLRKLDRLRLPTLFVYGGVELGEVNFRGLPAAIAESTSPGQPIQVATVSGANHVYTGKTDELSHKIRVWLAVEK